MMENVFIPEVVWFQEGPGVRNTQYTTSGVKLLNVANLVDGKVDTSNSFRYISEEEAYGKYKHFMVDEGDFIIASSGIKVEYFEKKMGFVKKEQLPLCMNTSTIRFKTLDENKLMMKYFMYFLKSERFKQQLFKQITGSAQLNFGPSHLKKMLIPLRDIDEQKTIVESLDKVYDVIENLKAQIEDLNKLIKSRFIEMFIQNDAMFPKKKLGECTIINPKKSMDNRLKDDLIVSFVPMASVGEDGSINTSDTKTYCEVKSGFTYFIDGDVLFAKITPCMENGKGAVATHLHNGIGFGSTEFHVIRPLEGITNPLWLYTLSVLKEFRQAAEANMTGSAGQKRTPASFLQNYEIKLPPIDIQNQFADFVAQVDKSKLAVQQSLNELETLKKSLMQQYFG